MRDKLKKVKQNYFNIGRLNNKSFVFNNENYENNIKEISLYRNKITEKTSTRENSRFFDKITNQFSSFEKKSTYHNKNHNIQKYSHKNNFNHTLDKKKNYNNNNISNNHNKNKICHCRDIILCDDETFNLTTIKNMLKKFNIECDTSTNGKECIDSIINKKQLNCNCEKNNYKLIFLDMMMPIMNGLEAAKKIQK